MSKNPTNGRIVMSAAAGTPNDVPETVMNLWHRLYRDDPARTTEYLGNMQGLLIELMRIVRERVARGDAVIRYPAIDAATANNMVAMAEAMLVIVLRGLAELEDEQQKKQQGGGK